MNLSIGDLSYWEQKMYFDSLDFVVVGAGIVGISSAYHLKEKHPKAKVLVIDKGILPFAASSKNAGFACFGSPSEILSDLRTMDSLKVWKTVSKRLEGLNALRKWLGDEDIGLNINGSWDLTQQKESSTYILDNLNLLNFEMEKLTGQKDVFTEDKDAIVKFGFDSIHSAFKNKLEGQIDTSKLNLLLLKKAAEKDILILRGIEMKSFATFTNKVEVETNLGAFSCANLIICTNGFTPDILPKMQVDPARAQVLITNRLNNLKINGTFHLDDGYFYFRNIDSRILIGGGRNHNFKQENTDKIEITNDIQMVIEHVLKTIVLPNNPFRIEHRWAGIMGVGKEKYPLIERLNLRVCAGVRMGGMGIAIGTLVGQELAQLHS